MIDEFHAKAGKGIGHFGDKLLLLTTHGAKSGQVRTTPLVYHRDGDRYVIAASKGGAPSHPGWYHNLVKHREAEIEVGTEKFKVRATPSQRDRSATASTERTVTTAPGSATTRAGRSASSPSSCWSAFPTRAQQAPEPLRWPPTRQPPAGRATSRASSARRRSSNRRPRPSGSRPVQRPKRPLRSPRGTPVSSG